MCASLDLSLICLSSEDQVTIPPLAQGGPTHLRSQRGGQKESFPPAVKWPISIWLATPGHCTEHKVWRPFYWVLPVTGLGVDGVTVWGGISITWRGMEVLVWVCVWAPLRAIYIHITRLRSQWQSHISSIWDIVIREPGLSHDCLHTVSNSPNQRQLLV